MLVQWGNTTFLVTHLSDHRSLRFPSIGLHSGHIYIGYFYRNSGTFFTNRRNASTKASAILGQRQRASSRWRGQLHPLGSQFGQHIPLGQAWEKHFLNSCCCDLTILQTRSRQSASQNKQEGLRPKGLEVGTYCFNSRSSTCCVVVNLWYAYRKAGTKKGSPPCREGTKWFTSFFNVSALMLDSLQHSLWSSGADTFSP